MSYTATAIAIIVTSFSGGLLSSQLLHTNHCLCDCSGSDQSEEVLSILRSQLDRCGPEQLTAAAPPPPPEPAIESWPLFSWCLGGGLLLFAVVELRALRSLFAKSLWKEPALLPVRDASADPDPLNAAIVPRWRPTGGSVARQL